MWARERLKLFSVFHAPLPLKFPCFIGTKSLFFFLFGVGVAHANPILGLNSLSFLPHMRSISWLRNLMQKCETESDSLFSSKSKRKKFIHATCILTQDPQVLIFGKCTHSLMFVHVNFATLSILLTICLRVLVSSVFSSSSEKQHFFSPISRRKKSHDPSSVWQICF